MSKRGVKWLYDELPGLVSDGVLSEDAASKLKAYYGPVSAVNTKTLIMAACSIFGALFIGLGIMLLIGYNWMMLPRIIRALIAILPLLAGQAFCAWVLIKNIQSHGIKEASATFLSLMVGSSIAIVSQTYNIMGDTAVFYFMWSILILPLIYILDVTLPALIFVSGVTASVCYWQFDTTSPLFFWPLLAAIIPHFLKIRGRDEYKTRLYLLSLTICISLCVLPGFTFVRYFEDMWIVIYPAVFTCLFFIDKLSADKNNDNGLPFFNKFSVAALYFFALLAANDWIWTHYARSTMEHGFPISGQHLADYMVMAAVFFSSVALCGIRFYQKKDIFEGLLGLMPILMFAGYMMAVNGVSGFDLKILFNIYLLSLCVSKIALGVKTKLLGEINAGLVMMILFIIVRFFDMQLGFILKGIIFIMLGVLFIAFNVIFLRRVEVKHE